jgi:hypothetical protein
MVQFCKIDCINTYKIKKKQDAGSFDFVLKVIIILERVRVNLLCEELQADFLNQQRYVTEEIISALH